MPHETPGVAARRLGATLVSVVATRLELVANEWEEERIRLARAAIGVMVALFCAGMALVVGTVLIAAVFWDEHRLLALATLTALYCAGAACALWVVVRTLAAKPRLFDATLGVLEADRRALLDRRAE